MDISMDTSMDIHIHGNPAKMARVFLVNPNHGIVENPILDTNSVDFYGTTTLWFPSLNPVVGRYGSQP